MVPAKAATLFRRLNGKPSPVLAKNPAHDSLLGCELSIPIELSSEVPRCSKPSRDARMRAPRAVSSLDRFCAPYREGVSGRRASRIFDLPPAGRTKGWVMLTFGCHDAWVGGHGDEALRQLGWMAAWDASFLEPGQHVGATCSWHLQSG